MFPQRLLRSGLRRGDCATAASPGADSRVGGTAGEHLRRPYFAPGLCPPRLPARTACRSVAAAQVLAGKESSAPGLPLHESRQQGVPSRFVRTSAPHWRVGPLLSLRRFPGRLRVGRVGKVPPRWRSPPLSRRGAWRGERKAFPCCSAASPASAALRLARLPGAFGHQEAECLIRGFLK